MEKEIAEKNARVVKKSLTLFFSTFTFRNKKGGDAPWQLRKPLRKPQRRRPRRPPRRSNSSLLRSPGAWNFPSGMLVVHFTVTLPFWALAPKITGPETQKKPSTPRRKVSFFHWSVAIGPLSVVFWSQTFYLTCSKCEDTECSNGPRTTDH